RNGRRPARVPNRRRRWGSVGSPSSPQGSSSPFPLSTIADRDTHSLDTARRSQRRDHGTGHAAFAIIGSGEAIQTIGPERTDLGIAARGKELRGIRGTHREGHVNTPWFCEAYSCSRKRKTPSAYNAGGFLLDSRNPKGVAWRLARTQGGFYTVKCTCQPRILAFTRNESEPMKHLPIPTHL